MRKPAGSLRRANTCNEVSGGQGHGRRWGRPCGTVVLDHCREHRHLRVIVFILRTGGLDLGNEFLRTVALHFRFVVDVLLFYGRMNPQSLANVARQGLFPGIGARGLELLKPTLDLAVISFQERDRISRGILPSARGSSSLRHDISRVVTAAAAIWGYSIGFQRVAFRPEEAGR
jgi:hypothetical protein